MDIGAILADDQTSHFMISWQEKWPFGLKRTEQYSDKFNHQIALKQNKSLPTKVLN